jgi:hypothetical protein
LTWDRVAREATSFYERLLTSNQNDPPELFGQVRAGELYT